jgi:hypothetical protein
MGRDKPLALQVCGWICIVGPSVLLGLLVLSHFGDVADALAVTKGDTAGFARLQRRNLVLPRNVAISFGLVAADAACLAAMAVAGLGLLKGWHAARRTVVVGAGLAMVLALGQTIFGLVFLAVPGEPVSVGPFLQDAAVILLSINVCGVMFLPIVVEAFTGQWRPADIALIGTEASPVKQQSE